MQLLEVSERSKAISIRRIVVVRVPVRIDIAEIIRIVIIRRPLPPIVGGTGV